MNKKFLFAAVIVIISIVIGFVFGEVKIDTVENKATLKTMNPSDLVKKIEDTNSKDMSIIEKSTGDVLVEIDSVKYSSSTNPQKSEFYELALNKKSEYEFINVTPPSEDGFIKNIFFIGLILLGMIIIFSILKSRKKNAPTNPRYTLSNIGGLLPETKIEINRIINLYKDPEKFMKLNIKHPRGMLLHGPPGTGKTVIAQAIAHEMGAVFIEKSGSSFTEKFVGVGPSSVRKLFKEAKEQAPALIFVDEIDSIGVERGQKNGNQETENTLNEFLIQLANIQPEDQVFVVAATNRYDKLDEALLRFGRFDSKIKMDIPDLEGRVEIMKIHSANKPLDKDIEGSYNDIAKTLIGYTGADIEALFYFGALNAIENNREIINRSDLEIAKDQIELGSATRRIANKDIQERIAYHEAGHALIGTLVKRGSVNKATILPRGGAGGFVSFTKEEFALYTRQELIDQVAINLAGGAAEILKYGDHSHGVSGDIRQSKEIIDQMVEHFGMMSNDLRIGFSKKNRQEASEEIYSHAYDKCRNLLTEHSASLERIKEQLIIKETISGEEIQGLI